MAELLISAVPSGVTGWRSLALGDELTGAALDVLALGDELTGSAADAGPGRRRSQLPRIRPDALDAPDFVGIGAKPTRQDGQRGRRNGGGSPGVGCQLARPRPRWTIRFWLLKSRARPPPHPVTTRTSLYSQSLLYYIGVLRGSLSHCDRSSPPSPDWCGDVRRLRRDSYGLHWFLIRPQSADTDPPSPIVGLRCGFGLRLRAPSLFFSLACRRVPFSLRRLPLGFR